MPTLKASIFYLRREKQFSRLCVIQLAENVTSADLRHVSSIFSCFSNDNRINLYEEYIFLKKIYLCKHWYVLKIYLTSVTFEMGFLLPKPKFNMIEKWRLSKDMIHIFLEINFFINQNTNISKLSFRRIFN